MKTFEEITEHLTMLEQQGKGKHGYMDYEMLSRKMRSSHIFDSCFWKGFYNEWKAICNGGLSEEELRRRYAYFQDECIAKCSWDYGEEKQMRVYIGARNAYAYALDYDISPKNKNGTRQPRCRGNLGKDIAEREQIPLPEIG